IPGDVEIFAASGMVAITAVLLYLIARRSRLSAPSALAIALIFAFGTSAWSTASRALWQHAPSMLMLTAALYLLVLAQEPSSRWNSDYRRLRLVQFASLPLAF